MSLKTSRPSESYRAARRNAWRRHNAESDIGPMAWPVFNKPFPSGSNFGIGSVAHGRLTMWPRPSKYMPHIGAKQRAKAARISGAAA